jgi:hypothetical protein
VHGNNKLKYEVYSYFDTFRSVISHDQNLGMFDEYMHVALLWEHYCTVLKIKSIITLVGTKEM